MNINPKRRYFRLKPAAAERFKEYLAARNEAIEAKIAAAEDLLEKHGIPKGTVKLEVFERTHKIAFPEEIARHCPSLFTRERNGFVRLKQNRRDGKHILAQIEKHKVPTKSSWFPTLGLAGGWLVGMSWVEPRLGRYGDEIVLIGIPKDTEPGEEYEPDFDLVEEMSLAEWAALVERVEGAKAQGVA